MCILLLLLDDFQVFYLLHEEGFFVGASSGLNVAAAVQVFNVINIMTTQNYYYVQQNSMPKCYIQSDNLVFCISDC